MNLTQTANEIVRDIAETQRKSFQAGRARVKQVVEVPTSHLVPEGVDAYRDILKYNLKSQTKLGDKVVKKLTTAEAIPVPLKDPTARLQGMAHELVDSGGKLVDGLCDALIKIYPEKAMESLGKAMGDPACKVRDATKKMVAMEQEWLEKVTGPAKKSTQAPPRPTTSKKRAPAKKKTASKKKKAGPKGEKAAKAASA